MDPQTPYDKALSLLDAAHALDPTLTTTTTPPIPYELHYAQRMTSLLHLHTPSPSPALSLAIRAQHLRRWEIPRSSYPDGKVGYFAWRTFLKKRQAQMAREICEEAGVEEGVSARVGELVGKEGLVKGEGKGDEEVQVLEDVACLVFLMDQLEGFERGREEGEVLGILRKTWKKMGERGREVALGLEMGERARELVRTALEE